MDLSKPLLPHADVEHAVACTLVRDHAVEEYAARAVAAKLAPHLRLEAGELTLSDSPDGPQLLAAYAPELGRRLSSRLPALPPHATDAQREDRVGLRLRLLGIEPDTGMSIAPGTVRQQGLGDRVAAGESGADVVAGATSTDLAPLPDDPHDRVDARMARLRKLHGWR